MERPIPEAIDHQWYMRPVLFVSDIERAIGFYVEEVLVSISVEREALWT